MVFQSFGFCFVLFFFAGKKKKGKIKLSAISLLSFSLQENNPGNLTSVSTPNLLSAGVCLFFFLNLRVVSSAWSITFRWSISAIDMSRARACFPGRLPRSRFAGLQVLGLEMLMCLLISLMSHCVPLLLFCHVCIHF